MSTTTIAHCWTGAQNQNENDNDNGLAKDTHLSQLLLALDKKVKDET